MIVIRNIESFKLLTKLQLLRIWRETLANSVFEWLLAMVMMVFLTVMGGAIAGQISGIKTPEILLILIIVICMDFCMKIMLKKHTFVQIRPYLTMPVKKKSIFTWLVVRELFAFHNLLVLGFVTPLLLTGNFGWTSLQIWVVLLTLYVFSITNSLIINLIRMSRKVMMAFLFVLLLYGIALFVSYFFATWKNNLYDSVSLPALYAIFAVSCSICVALGVANVSQMKQSVYHMEQGGNKSAIPALLPNLKIFNIMTINILQMIRCKRLLGMMLTSIMMVAYGLLMFLKDSSSFLFFEQQFGLLMYFMSAGNICGVQFVLAYESTYFDGLYTRPIPLYQIVTSRYRLSVAMTAILFLILLPVCMFRHIPLYVPAAGFLFVAGPVFAMLFPSLLFAESRFELFDSAWRNSHGITFMQNVISFAVLIVSIVLLTICFNFLHPTETYIVMITVGIMVILVHHYWIHGLCKLFEKRKYKNMEGFRKTN